MFLGYSKEIQIYDGQNLEPRYSIFTHKQALSFNQTWKLSLDPFVTCSMVVLLKEKNYIKGRVR